MKAGGNECERQRVGTTSEIPSSVSQTSWGIFSSNPGTLYK